MFKAGHAIAAMCLVLALGSALNAAVARAGTYEVAICHDPAVGWTAPTDGISFPDSGSFVAAGVYRGCGNSGYLYATLDGVVAHGPGDLAAWEFQAPAGTTIAAAQVYRAFTAAATVPFRAPIDELDAISPGGAARVLDDCAQVFGCSSSGSGPLSEFASANLLDFGGLTNVTAIEGTAACGGGQACAAAGGAVCPELGGDPCIASNHLYAMVVTLEDDTAPTASNVSGTLVAPGVLAGVADVSFDATDTGSGLYSAALTVDGVAHPSTQIDASGGRCVPLDVSGSNGGQTGPLRFDWTVPCVLAGSGTLELDTSALRDGAHSLAVTVADAAGNASTVWSGTIHTENAPEGGTPQIFGDAQQGQTLIAGNGSWSPAPSGYAYQWERCDAAGSNCVAIPGATAPAYSVTAADEYRRLSVSITASNADGSTSALSPGSGVVLDANGYANRPQGPALAYGSLPAISGTTREGDTLSAQPGDWSNGPLSYLYQWERCDSAGLGCAPIAAAAGTSYKLVRADDYARVRVIVSVSGPGGTSQAASEPSRTIADATGSTVAPASGSPPGQAAPAAAATPRVVNGTGGCSDARLRATIDSASSVTIALGRSVTLRGSLECGGEPIKGAMVELAIASAGGPSPAHAVQIRTGANGSFAYVVGPGTSRRITLSYREFAGEGAPSASASATVLVMPLISLSVTPTRTSNGRTITFSGRVSGGDEPRGGLPLDLEYREGRRWMIYTVVKTSPGHGRFVYRYTFERTTQPITYTFRVAIPSSGVTGYPYQPAASPSRSVHVNP